MAKTKAAYSTKDKAKYKMNMNHLNALRTYPEYKAIKRIRVFTERRKGGKLYHKLWGFKFAGTTDTQLKKLIKILPSYVDYRIEKRYDLTSLYLTFK